MSEYAEFTLKSAWPLIKRKETEYEASLQSMPEAGIIKPVSISPWMAAVYSDMQRQPKLCQAAIQAPDTMWESLSAAAQVGLIPGSAGGQFYLIPRYSKRRSRMECSFIVGYKGMTELAFRHPRVHKVEAFLVMETDEFNWQPGGDVRHTIDFKAPRVVKDDLSNIIGAYARIVLTVHNSTQVDQAPVIEWMGVDEILAIRGRSEAAQRGFSPWKTDPGRMARKTPIRRACNGGAVPQSASLIMAMSAENNEGAKLEADIAEIVNPTEEVSNTLRQAAGLKLKPALPDCDLVEEAIAFVEAAKDEALLDAAEGFSFEGEDKKLLMQAVELRRSELTES